MADTIVLPATEESKAGPPGIKERPKLHRQLWLVGWGIIISLFIVAGLIWRATFSSVSESEINIGLTISEVALTYLFLSLKMTRADELAGAYCYGRALVRLDSGPHFIPFGLMQMRRAFKSVREFQCPDEPENIFKGDDKDDLPREGMVRPIRIVTGDIKKGEDPKDTLDVRMTIVQSFFFRYAITDIFDFVSNFGGDEKNIRMQLRDIGEKTVAEHATEKTVSSFINELPGMNLALSKEVSKQFTGSGVTIYAAAMISPDITHEVSIELAGIPKARAKAEQARVTADGERYKREMERKGDADGEKAWLEAQADGRKKMMGDLKVSGESVLASEAVRTINDKTDVIVVGANGGMRDIMSLVTGAQSALRSRDNKSAQQSTTVGKGGKS